MNVLTSRIGKRDQNTSIRCEATDQNFNCGKQGYTIMILLVRLAQVSGFTHRYSALAALKFLYTLLVSQARPSGAFPGPCRFYLKMHSYKCQLNCGKAAQ